MATTNWKAVTGDWSTAADWTNGVPDSPTTIANLGGAASYTVTVSGGETFKIGTLNLTDVNAALSLGGTLTVSTLINLSAGVLTLSGDIVGGAIKQTGGSIVYANGMLDGVKFEGTMDLSANSATVRVYNGLSLTGSTGTGPGTVNVTGSSSQLNFYGNQTIDNATINIGSTGTSYLQIFDTIPGAILALGSGINLVSQGNVYLIGSSDATLVNKGKITAATGGASFSIASIAFRNFGTIAIGNGESFTINASSFSNTGKITIATGAVLHLNGSLVGTALGSITASTGTVSIDGTLDETGATLNVGTGSALRTVTLTGAIENGTIHDGGTGFAFSNGTLDAVTYQGAMNLATSGAIVRIYDGITLTGAAGTGVGTVNITGQSAQMYFYGTQTIDNATIHIGSVSNTDYLFAYNTGPMATLTLGSNLSLVSTGTSVYLIGSSSRIVNKGTITAATGGGAFNVDPTVFTNAGKINIGNGESFTINASSFSNTGKITVATGAVLHLNGLLVGTALGSITATTGTVSIDGTLDETGATLNVGTGSALRTVTLTGAIQNGIIHDGGTGFAFSSGTLDAVTYQGAMNLDTSGAIVRIYDGITLTGATGTGVGTANITGQSAQMFFYGTQTIDNATIHIGSASNTDYLFAYNTGPMATLTLGSNLSLVSTGTSVYLTGSGSRIVNKGTIIASTGGGTFTINPTAFTNAGKIVIGNNETVHIAAFTNTSVAEVVNGTLDLQSGVLGSGGTLKIDAAGTLEVEQAIGIGQKVIFSGQGGRLRIDSADQFAAGVSGFTGSDVINLSTISAVAGTTVSFSGTATQGTVKVTDGTHTASINLFGQYVAAGFHLGTDSHGGSALTYTPPAAAHTLQLAAGH
jgi:hypothetical protein